MGVVKSQLSLLYEWHNLSKELKFAHIKMNKTFYIPYIICQDCKYTSLKGQYVLVADYGPTGIKALKISCTTCQWKTDLLEVANRQTTEVKQKASKLGKQLAKSLIQMKNTLPKDKNGLKEVVTNPQHPFTAAVLAGLVILAMELSGFGVFAFATWVLAHLILNPVGWVLAPVVVAVALAYKNGFKKENIDQLRASIVELDRNVADGKISRSEYEILRDQLLAAHFSKQ